VTYIARRKVAAGNSRKPQTDILIDLPHCY